MERDAGTGSAYGPTALTRVLSRALALGGLLLLAGALIACADPIPTDSPAPTSTPTPEPTPTLVSTETPAAVEVTATAPSTADVGVLADAGPVMELLSAIPAEYDSAVYLDVMFLLDDPDLRAAFEEQGGLSVLGPAAGPVEEMVDSLVVAEGDPGLLAAVRSASGVQSLVDGVLPQNLNVESETHGPFEITSLEISLPILSLKIAGSLISDRVALITVSTSATGAVVDQIKVALDTAQGEGSGIISGPLMQQLIEVVPAGFTVLVARDCTVAFDDYEGCGGFVMSTTREADHGIIDAALGFETPQLLQAALPRIEAEMDTGLEPGSLGATEVSVQGNLLLLRTRVDISEAILTAFGE